MARKKRIEIQLKDRRGGGFCYAVRVSGKKVNSHEIRDLSGAIAFVDGYTNGQVKLSVEKRFGYFA